MADVHSKEIRSYNMGRIKAKNTKPEIVVRKFLYKNGFRYRIHVKYLPGKPDIVMPKYRTVIFVHGCFWHSHDGCKQNRIPQSNQAYWMSKLSGNVSKDKRNEFELTNQGWNVITIWECDLKKNKIDHTLARVLLYLSLTVPRN